MNTIVYWQFLARPAQRYRLSIKSIWIPDEGILTSFSPPANGSKLSSISVFPIPLVFIFWHTLCLASCLDFESKFWTVSHGPDWETRYECPLVVVPFSSVTAPKSWARHPLNSLLRSMANGLTRPLPIHTVK